MNRPRPVPLLAAALALAAGATAAFALGGGPQRAPGSGARPPMGEVVPSDGSFEIGEGPARYRIVYLLDDLSDAQVAPSTDVVLVTRPSESRLETLRGGPPGGDLISVQIAALDRLRLGQATEPLVIARVPGVGMSDLRLAHIVGPGVEQGLLALREQRLVAGRRCQVLRSGTLLGSGPLVPITEGEWAESCVDAEGLLLEEVLFLEGQPTLHRIAVAVDTSPTITVGAFIAGEIVVPVDQGGGSSVAVSPDQGAIGPFWILPSDALPTGFSHLGRHSIVPSQPDRFAAVGDPAIVAGTADVYVRGPDLIVVWQGATLGGVVAFPPVRHALAIDGGRLGQGAQVLGARGIELRFPQPRGAFVHVIGTLAPAELLDVARALVETEGTGLVPLKSN